MGRLSYEWQNPEFTISISRKRKRRGNGKVEDLNSVDL